MVNASAVGTEVLKNLVLPGIFSLTIWGPVCIPCGKTISSLAWI